MELPESTPQRQDDSALFIEQGRWLLEWHNRRAEALTTRAVALLGFDGVMLALLLQGANVEGVDPTGLTWSLLALALTALLVAAFFALRTISLKRVEAPPVPQLRSQWLKHRESHNTGAAGPNIAEAFLNSQDLTGPSAVSSAKQDADDRADEFKRCLRAMMTAFVLLSLLVLNVLTHVWGR